MMTVSNFCPFLTFRLGLLKPMTFTMVCSFGLFFYIYFFGGRPAAKGIDSGVGEMICQPDDF